EEINDMIDLVHKTQDDYGDLTRQLSILTREIDFVVNKGCSQEQLKGLHGRLAQFVRHIQLPEKA
ncbi:MAG: hypothetical protein L3J63_10010, partial [Geopsychrobacter sp.]|nr:hypothetical protein [Geopsychrobacter sp.]